MRFVGGSAGGEAICRNNAGRLDSRYARTSLAQTAHGHVQTQIRPTVACCGRCPSYDLCQKLWFVWAVSQGDAFVFVYSFGTAEWWLVADGPPQDQGPDGGAEEEVRGVGSGTSNDANMMCRSLGRCARVGES